MIFIYEDRYYILDWKSNHLGDDALNYTDENMEKAVKSHSYDLQYMLYAVALKKMLALSGMLKDFDSIFGGILYVFIRGIDAGKNTGVYFRKPLNAEISRLESIICAGAA
jgi:exodeoxyribonuclease V beta subunit